MSARANGSGDAAGRPLTILQILPRLNAGGVERGALEIVQAIVAAGGRALVASAGGRMEARFRQAGAELFTLRLASKNPARIWLNAGALQRVIAAEGVDVVHARSRAPAWSARWAARRAGVRFVTTYHGTYSEGPPLKRRYNSVMASGDRVIAISQFIAERIMTLHRTPRERITVIPRGADVSAFAEERVSSARVICLAEAWRLADDPRPMVMMPGRLTRWKGQLVFLEAMALVRRRRSAQFARGVIVGGDEGDGSYADELRAAIERLYLRDTVTMVGHCDDMPAAYRLAQLAVSASLDPEAFGRVAVEAQAMGVPVAASAHGGARETVIDGETGWWFAPGDANALADVIETALDLGPETRRVMAQAAVENVRRNFTVEAMQRRTLRVYEALAGRAFQPVG